MAINTFATSTLSQPTASPMNPANGTGISEGHRPTCHLDDIDGNVKIAFIAMAVTIGLLFAALLGSCCCQGGKLKTGKKLKESTMSVASKFH
jgi:uncharacterized Zn-binding protein involved in type VI secretion